METADRAVEQEVVAHLRMVADRLELSQCDVDIA